MSKPPKSDNIRDSLVCINSDNIQPEVYRSHLLLRNKMATPKLFTPTKVGGNTLQHRIVFAPTTRLRADDKHVPIVELVAEHYAQRAAVPGTLLIAEGTLISPQAGGFGNAPGIWSKEQVSAWKQVHILSWVPLYLIFEANAIRMWQVVDAVHERGSFIYVQLAAIGRAALLDVLEKDGGHPLVSSSDVLLTGASAPPRPLTVEGQRVVIYLTVNMLTLSFLTEIKQYVEDFATAAYNAVHGAGFDGVEIHGANGYLIDQFIQDNANKRTDEYGGSTENRARFVLEIADAVVAKVGAEKTALRVSPWSRFQGEFDPVLLSTAKNDGFARHAHGGPHTYLQLHRSATRRQVS